MWLFYEPKAEADDSGSADSSAMDGAATADAAPPRATAAQNPEPADPVGSTEDLGMAAAPAPAIPAASAAQMKQGEEVAEAPPNDDNATPNLGHLSPVNTVSSTAPSNRRLERPAADGPFALDAEQTALARKAFAAVMNENCSEAIQLYSMLVVRPENPNPSFRPFVDELRKRCAIAPRKTGKENE